MIKAEALITKKLYMREEERRKKKSADPISLGSNKIP